MTELLQRLVHSLRDELQQYGEMLALLEHQQDLVVARATNDLLQTVSAINRQADVIRAVRLTRLQHQSTLASALGLEPNTTFELILPLLPEQYQPLLQALVEENNALLVRVQSRARQNHLLLDRSLELLQNLLNTLITATHIPIYNENGLMFRPATPAHSLYEAVG